MPLSRRYTPEFPPGESSVIGYDFSFIIPPGVGIASGALNILTNTAAPQPANSDFTIGPVGVRGRAIYASLTGGVLGTDYQLHWTAFDTSGNEWPRTGLLLCAFTS
jgi:hypothetical protein